MSGFVYKKQRLLGRSGMSGEGGLSFSAPVAELADALDSKSSEGNFMGVRLSPEAPTNGGFPPIFIPQTKPDN